MDTLPTERPGTPPLALLEPMPGTLLWTIVIASLAVSLTTVLGAVLSFVSHDNPFAILGGIFLLPPAIIAAYLQIMAVSKRQPIAARVSSYGYWCGAGFALFALVSNTFEAISKKEWGSVSFWLIFGSICVTIFSTCVVCARIYGNWANQLDRYQQSLRTRPRTTS